MNFNDSFKVTDPEELEYAERTHRAIKACIEAETAASGRRRNQILEQRRYFSDYFSELKDDEKLDLLSNEALDTRDYLGSMSHLKKLWRQEQEPYFAGFDYEYEDEPGELNRVYISLETLRDPETDEIITFDWRAPVCSLYYESEPGKASFDTPAGKQNVDLLEKRRYRFEKGKLMRVSRISMPSDDEILSDALSRNAGEHMRIIVESLQKEQHRIVRDHIEGVTVISGCAGSGKTSVALHKAAYILYGFRNRMKEEELAIISPNDYFSEYISTVLPDLGEDNIRPYLQEDLLKEILDDIGEVNFMSRLDEAEMAGEFGLESSADNNSVAEAISICRRLKSSEAFRKLVVSYINYLEKNIFVAEPMELTEEKEGSVSAELLSELFYSVFEDVPVFKRTARIRDELCRRYGIHTEANKEYILSTLDSMMLGLSAPELYRRLYTDGKFREQCGIDLTPLTFFSDMFEDACAVALIHIALAGPELKGVFYLICDEAQDLSAIFLEVLRRRFPGTNMLFVGDSDQAVFGNTGDFVARIKSIIPRRPFKRYTLDTNYRSTTQIVDYSASVLGREPGMIRSVRDGRMPEHIYIGSGTDEAGLNDAINRICAEAEAAGMESVAFITMTREQAERLRRACGFSGNVPGSLRKYFMPVYLAKGLEFDAVAVFGADNPYFSSEEGKLALYTACTRALHMLFLLDNSKTESGSFQDSGSALDSK